MAFNVRKAPGYLACFLSVSLLVSLVYMSAAVRVEAKELPAENKAKLMATIDMFLTAMKNRDFAKIVDLSISPALLRHIAVKSGIKSSDQKDLAGFKKAIAGSMAKVFKQQVKLVSFVMDKKSITYHELPDGTIYALIPTQTLMAAKGRKFKATDQTLGLANNGKWHLLRINKPKQINMLKVVYPQFKNVEFKVGSMEEVK